MGLTRGPYPVFKRLQLDLFKMFIHSSIHSCTQHALMHVHYALGSGLGLEMEIPRDRVTLCFHGAVILVGEIYSKEINGSISSIMKGSQVF